MRVTPTFKHLADDRLAAEVTRLAQHQRAALATFVACLAEFEARRLHLALGFCSIYSFCAERLHLTEGAAYRRIESGRLSRRIPVVLEMLRDGRLSLATAALLGPRLTPANAATLLPQCAFKSKRQVEHLLARLYPRPAVPSVIRKLPDNHVVDTPGAHDRDKEVTTDRPANTNPVERPSPSIDRSEPLAAPPPELLQPPQPASRRPVIAPLSEAKYKLQVTIGAVAHDRLRAIQDLMRHRIPNGDPAAIVEHALELLHGELLKQKAAIVAKPRVRRTGGGEGQAGEAATGRYIPATVQRAVWRRDAGRCTFVGPDGRKCGSASAVEFHHLQPYVTGGAATAQNIALRCRAHNVFEWTQHLDDETAALLR